MLRAIKKAPKPKRLPRAAPGDRRQAILDAALDVFAEHGYAGARLDDVAARAGIAKGTIYLHFADKRALFMELARGAAAPMFERIGALALSDAPIGDLLRALTAQFREHVLGSRRKEVFRLIMSEGSRFPELAEFHHREIIAKLLPVLRGILERADARGELASGAAARFPHLVIAPLLLSILWDGLFGVIEPLDNAGLFEAHVELLTGRPFKADT